MELRNLLNYTSDHSNVYNMFHFSFHLQVIIKQKLNQNEKRLGKTEYPLLFPMVWKMNDQALI